MILATHGRGIQIIDDITPLRHLSSETLDAAAALLPSRVQTMVIPSSQQRFNGDNEFIGRGKPSGASIVYILKKRHMFGDLKIDIHDSSGEWIATLPTTKRRGLNRVVWSMRGRAPKVPPAASLVPQFFSFLGAASPGGDLHGQVDPRQGNLRDAARNRARPGRRLQRRGDGRAGPCRRAALRDGRAPDLPRRSSDRRAGPGPRSTLGAQGTRQTRSSGWTISSRRSKTSANSSSPRARAASSPGRSSFAKS